MLCELRWKYDIFIYFKFFFWWWGFDVEIILLMIYFVIFIVEYMDRRESINVFVNKDVINIFGGKIYS